MRDYGYVFRLERSQNVIHEYLLRKLLRRCLHQNGDKSIKRNGWNIKNSRAIQKGNRGTVWDNSDEKDHNHGC